MSAGRWTDEYMQGLRSLGDPVADAVITALFAEGKIEAVNDLLQNLVTNEELTPAGLPSVVQDYLVKTAALPSWSDRSVLDAGEAAFCEYGPSLVTVLMCASLPECYACGRGAEVLFRTAKLSSGATRRIIETAQFVLDVMSPGGLEAGGFGIRTTQKVRLMHAAIRHLASADPNWNPDWGLPINQEDLLGTLMTFSIVGIEGLTKLGIPLSEPEKAAYLHAWCCVGFILGIREDLLPKTVAEAAEIMDAIRRHQHQATEAGKELTAALLKFVKELIPGEHFDGIPNAITYYLVGSETAQLLAVDEPDWTRFLIGPLKMLNLLVDKMEHRSQIINHLSEKFNLVLMKAFVTVERGGDRPGFRIPSALAEKWNIN